MRHALVYFDSLSEGARAALEERRAQIQGAVNVQTRLKRTPKLSLQGRSGRGQRRGGRGAAAASAP